MWWRVRTSLPDRPGALAALAQRSGEAGVDIRGLQIFPGVETVTDELVLETPDGWGEADLRDLVEGAGWHLLTAQPCSPEALLDQPTRFVAAARAVIASPASFPEVVARLFDAEAEPASGAASDLDTLEMVVDGVQVQVRRTAPFTDVERERGAAMAGLVGDVLHSVSRAAAEAPPALAASAARRLGAGAVPEHVVEGDRVSAVVDGVTVALAVVEPALPPLDGDEGAVHPVTLRVDAAWQRRGIGTRLLVDAARLAGSLGATEILLTTRADNQAVLPMVLAAGLRGRIRMAADTLTVRVPVQGLRPLSR